MAVHPILTKQYAVNIYRYGNRTFATIPVEYHPSTIKYAGETFTLAVIDNALEKGFITPEEHTTTLTIKSEFEKEQETPTP